MSLGKSKRKDPSPFNKEQGICRDASGAVIPCEEGGLVRKKASPPNEGGGPEEAAANQKMLKGAGHVHTAEAFLRSTWGGIPGALVRTVQTMFRDRPPKEDVTGVGHLGMADHDANAPATKRGHRREAFPNRQQRRGPNLGFHTGTGRGPTKAEKDRERERIISRKH